MAIISQESFDRFTGEEKNKIRENYANFTYLAEEGVDEEERIVNFHLKATMEDYFGKENLQHEPKTWEDLEKSSYFVDKFELSEVFKLEDTDFYRGASTLMQDNSEIQLKDKIIATYKIAKLIELGYGGMIIKEEWENNQADFIGIYYCPKSKKYEFRVPLLYHFLTFRNREVAEEFMSYKENVKLIHQYYMI